LEYGTNFHVTALGTEFQPILLMGFTYLAQVQLYFVDLCRWPDFLPVFFAIKTAFATNGQRMPTRVEQGYLQSFRFVLTKPRERP
jgi:hypothetical protein